MKMELSKNRINEIFEENTEVVTCILGLFKEVIPNWDNVETIGHFPQVSKKTNEYLFDKVIEKGEGNGSTGYTGFGSIDSIMEDWVVLIEEEKITYVK